MYSKNLVMIGLHFFGDNDIKRQCLGIFRAQLVKTLVLPSRSGYMSWSCSFFLDCFELYSIDSSNMMGDFPEILNSNRSLLKHNRFICK